MDKEQKYTFSLWQRTLGYLYMLYGSCWFWTLGLFKRCSKGWYICVSQCGFVRHPYYEITQEEKK